MTLGARFSALNVPLRGPDNNPIIRGYEWQRLPIEMVAGLFNDARATSLATNHSSET
jgi:hypothetical protein